MMIEHIKKHLDELPRDRAETSPIRASNSGKCARAIAYQLHGYESTPLNWRAKLVFDLGDKIEDQLATIAVQYGLTDRQSEVSVVIDGHEIKGHLDGMWNGAPIDFKSCAARSFTTAKKGDIGSYIFTMHFYMKATNTDSSVLVYYNKDTSDLCEVIVPFDDGVWSLVEARFRRVFASTKENLPEREFKMNDKGVLPWQCSYCGYNKHCWPSQVLSFTSAGKPVLTNNGDTLSPENKGAL